MELKDEREVEVTREKLQSLEARYQAVKQDPGEADHIQQLTLRSLKRMINQMKEEIARFEARRSSEAGRSRTAVARNLIPLVFTWSQGRLTPRQLDNLILGDLPGIDGGGMRLEGRDVAVADQVELAGLLGG